MLDKIRKLLLNYVDNADSVTEDSRLIADVGLSSLDAMIFLADVEEAFSLPRLSEKEIAGILTVGDVMHLIEEKTGC